MIIYGRPNTIQVMKKVRTQHAHTFARCRGCFCARRTLSIRVFIAFEKYFIAYGFVEVSFFALEVTFCPFINVFSIWIVNGVDYDSRD